MKFKCIKTDKFVKDSWREQWPNWFLRYQSEVSALTRTPSHWADTLVIGQNTSGLLHPSIACGWPQRDQGSWPLPLQCQQAQTAAEHHPDVEQKMEKNLKPVISQSFPTGNECIFVRMDMYCAGFWVILFIQVNLTALAGFPKSIFKRPMALMIAMMDWIVLLKTTTLYCLHSSSE